MKKLFPAVRLFATAAIFMAACVEAQQPPGQVTPGTPGNAAPKSSTGSQASSSQTAPLQPVGQDQSGNAASSSLYGPWFLQVFYWVPSTRSYLLGGNGATGDQDLYYPHTSKDAPEVELSFPVSKASMLDFSGFITKSSIATYAPYDTTLFGTAYSAGDYITATYNVKNFKLSYQDLLYPYPRKEEQKWRVKTLWEVQYASIGTNINAPFAPTETTTGTAIVNTASGSRWLVYPSFGLSGEYHPVHNLTLQLNGSGFMIPHHDTIGDAEFSIGYRISHVELMVAEQYFHFKTSEQNNQFFKTTLWGASAGLRFYPSGISIPCPFCRRGKSTTAANTSTTGSTSSTAAPAPSTTASAPSTTPAAPSATAATTSTTTQGAPPSGPSEVTTSSKQGSSTSSTTPQQGTFIHRVSAGATLSVLGLSLIPSRTSTIYTSTTLNTIYSTTGASERIGYGLTAQVAVTDHFSVLAQGLLRRIGYQLDTTVTTTKETLVDGVETETSTSTGTHEDTRASLIDLPVVARYYTRDRHERGTRFFLELGGAWRDSRDIRTSISMTNASSVLTCCTFTPAVPEHRDAFGPVVGAGILFIDAFGIHVAPEVIYTRWMHPIFENLTTDTRSSEIAAGITIGF